MYLLFLKICTGHLCGMVLAVSNPFMRKMQQVSNTIILHLKVGNENNKASNDSVAYNATTWSFKTCICTLSSFLALSSSNALCLSNPDLSSLTPIGL
jgi:hypothetical protein